METFDRSQFRIRINIKCSVDKLFHCWATRSGMEYWFLRTCEYRKAGGLLLEKDEITEPGDVFKWLWHGYGDDVAEDGEILSCNGKDHLKFRFGKAGNCSISMYPEEGEMILDLLQDEIPTDDKALVEWHIGCKTGWTFYLSNLKSLLEGGIDLRNRNEKLKRVISA